MWGSRVQTMHEPLTQHAGGPPRLQRDCSVFRNVPEVPQVHRKRGTMDPWGTPDLSISIPVAASGKPSLLGGILPCASLTL